MLNEDLQIPNIRGWRSQTETGAFQGDQPGRRVAGSCAWGLRSAQQWQRQHERWDAGQLERLPQEPAQPAPVPPLPSSLVET